MQREKNKEPTLFGELPVLLLFQDQYSFMAFHPATRYTGKNSSFEAQVYRAGF